MDKITSLQNKHFGQMLKSGAINLKAHMEEVNNLNVFPVADGDTATNMYMTLSGGIKAITNKSFETIGELSQTLSRGMVMSARGNSGVILSQIFYGIAQGLNDVKEATVQTFASALKLGIRYAYDAVVEAVEGTILTVLREGISLAINDIVETSTINSFVTDCLKYMKITLDKTPDMLKVLKEAGVVDSGGAGLVYIFEGMNLALNGDGLRQNIEDETIDAMVNVDIDKFTEDSVMEFGYCTEFLLRLQNGKINVNLFELDEYRKGLEALGDSIVTFKNDTVVKTHIHTMTPEVVLAYAHKFGEFLTLKIENMSLQHNESVFANKNNNALQSHNDMNKRRKKYGVVTVANGEGLIKTFCDLGADYCINGGQTNNPSTQDFINAFDSVNADNIFVFPNNTNIILTAKQAGEIYKKSKVYVVESKNIGEGYTMLSMLDFTSDNIDTILENFNLSIEGVKTIIVTKSVRSTSLNNMNIKENDYIGYEDKNMLASKASKIDTASLSLEKVNAENHCLAVVIYGKNAKTDQQEFSKMFKGKCPNTEFYEIDGGQEIYDFIIILQ